MLVVGCFPILIFPMPDYALMNQCLYEGKAKGVEEMTGGGTSPGMPRQNIVAMLKALEEFNGKK
jgi:hypothetical protein